MTAPTTPLIAREHEVWLQEQRALLDRLAALARAIDLSGRDAEDAAMLRRHVDERFLLVIVGEVKAGKSSFINALIGRDVCAVGPTPLTDRIQVLQWGTGGERSHEEFLVERDVDVELLREISLVDTPGTNSILKQHSALTERFIPRADLVLFLTSIDRPLSDSENTFLSLISERWRKKVVFLLTKIDGRDPADVRAVVDWLVAICLEHHGFAPVVLPISSRLEREGKDGGFTALRAFVQATLAEGEKMRLKLASPVASSRAVVQSLAATLAARTSTLDADFRAVQDLDRQVEQAGRDLKERAHRHLTEIHDLFAACEQRAKHFFDAQARWQGLSLFKKEAPVRDAFDRQVLDELETKYAGVVEQVLDWIVKEEIGLYERCTAFLHEKGRPEAAAHALPAEPARFEYRRDQVFRTVLDTYRKEKAERDIPGESRRLLAAAEAGVKKRLAYTVGAIGLSAASLALLQTFSTLWLNFAGLAVALGLGLTGWIVLPAVRRRALRQFCDRLDQLLAQVRTSFVRAVEQEVDGAIARLRRAWEPFLLFHRTEAATLAERQRELGELRVAFGDLERRLAENASNRRFA